MQSSRGNTAAKRRVVTVAAALLAAGVSAAVPALAQLGGLNCTIRPSREVSVSASLPLVVTQVLVRPGQYVTPGAPLVQLDDTLLRAELAMAEARAAMLSGVEAARIRHEGLQRRVLRLTEARARNAITAAEYESATLELGLAEVEVMREEELLSLAQLERDRVLAQLEATRVLAPIAGIVGETLVAPGEMSQPNPLATIYDITPLRVEVFVPTAVLGQFVAAGNHQIRLADHAQPIEVQLDYAAPQADLASNTVSVFFTLDTEGVLPGSRCMMPWGQS